MASAGVRFFNSFFVLIGLSSVTLVAHAMVPTALLVEKKSNQLFVTQYVDGAFQKLKNYHVTIGQVQGDKEVEGDLKTPEGIYSFDGMRKAPNVPFKLGAMAFHMNYPNPFDQMIGHTGSGIAFHATNEPDRLKKNYDSEGCIVVRNEEIQEIHPWIRLGLTPILVFNEILPEHWSPGKDATLTQFFQSWLDSWKNKKIDDYIGAYHSKFKSKGMDKAHWREFKDGLNHRYKEIEIKAENVVFLKHPKYAMVSFVQDYQSALKSGGAGHRSRGTKILTLSFEEGKPKIIDEAYTTAMW